MAESVFRFKQFSISQSRAAMKVGTDGVLLGAWAEIRNGADVLDIGTGTGLIALMLRQRCKCSITAIDIEPGACADALQNAAGSLWDTDIKVLNISAQELSAAGIKYDLVISNPPYFATALPTSSKERDLARYSGSLSVQELVECSNIMMRKTGSIALILPQAVFHRAAAEIEKTGMSIYRKCSIVPYPGKAPKRIMLQAGYLRKEVEISELVIESGGRHNYSAGYKELTKDFYLNF
jgi:tRNA1Val (adenine37-N6)-methyltransferase